MLRRHDVTGTLRTLALGARRWYASVRQLIDPDLPTIHGLPREFFQ